MSRQEPALIRCSRCDALVAFLDAVRCEYHETDPLCQYCWKHHVLTRNVEHARLQDQCWAMTPLEITWRR